MLRNHMETIYSDYIKIFGSSACTDAFRQFLDRGCELTDYNNHRDGHVMASSLMWHPPSDTILRVLHEKLGIWVWSAGGKLLDGETPCEAAARETKEEIGVTAEPLFWSTRHIPLMINQHQFPENAVQGRPTYPIYDFVYLFAATSMEIIADRKEIRDHVWEHPIDVRVEHSERRLSEQISLFLNSPAHKVFCNG